jgi:murein DD-endopeptidase MepM/ murein hydrolase activator NlpD
MKFNLKLLQSKIGKNLEFFFVLLLILISVAITQIYNISRDISKKEYVGLINNLYFQKTVNNILDNLQPKYRNIEHKVAKNETLSSIFKNYDVSEKETNLILKKLREKNKKISTLKVNQIIKFTINESNKKVSTVIYPISKTKKIELIWNAENDSFTRREIITNLKKRIIFKEAKILQSLYKSAVNQSIPANVIVEFARIYGFQVDFQRDIRRNDTFQIIYETFEDENKKVFTTGNILYADLNLSNQSNSFYYFDLKDEEGHYDLNGKSVKKALMKTPINGARLSSKFGMRKHPIDGYNKMHRGTDFAAPEGTPVMASGDGVIIKAAWCGGGGNCVKIKHNSTYSTVYAHLSKFGGSIKKGKRVKQGQIIGYVGSTGKSTGPHLHYEVIHNGARINSQKLKLPSGKILKGKARKLFEIKKIKLDVLKSEIIASMN